MKIDKSWHNALCAVKYMHNKHHYNFPSKKINLFLDAIGYNTNDNEFMAWLGREYDKWLSGMTFVIRMQDGEIFYISAGRDVDFLKISNIGETINKYVYDNFLAQAVELSDYSGCEIRKSIIIRID